MAARRRSGGPSLSAFRGRYVVVKLGGTGDIDAGRVGLDISSLVEAGARVVVAHGGGDTLTAWMKSHERPSRWIDGLRVTDARTRDDAVMIYRGVVAPAVIGELVQAGVSAVGIGGPDGGVIRVRRRSPELGYVGAIRSVRMDLLEDLTTGGHVPVVSPLGLGPRGELYNVNGDDVAGAIARAARAAALVFLTDVDGVRDAEGRIIPLLDRRTARALIRRGVIAGGMLPKVRSALRLLRSVEAVVIANAAHAHVLRDALGAKQTGTRIVP